MKKPEPIRDETGRSARGVALIATDSDPLARWAEKNPDSLQKMAFYGAQIVSVTVAPIDCKLAPSHE